ncbi:hypothetical protein SB8_06190 [Pseudomonas oryzihabitans]|nr:hypothetical protein SB8_06190 [Pseudomonas psychrotolerans]
MKYKGWGVTGLALVLAGLSGCQTPNADNYASNVYTVNQVNARQLARTVNILAILPAKIEVNDTSSQQNTQLIGALLGVVTGAVLGNSLGGAGGGMLGGIGGGALGAAGGSVLPHTRLVDGVSITYADAGETFNSAQVGAPCQFAPGAAIMVASSPTETRIQPNATCPVAR